ncbi:MAG: permease [Elioraea sp.]|nr:permease [Elioraea sp.]
MSTPQSPPARPSPRHASLAFVALLCVGAATACFLLRGAEGLTEGLASAGNLARAVLPVMVPALFLAAVIQGGVGRERIGRLLGADSGLKGLLLASAAGMATPGGPMAAFPLVAALAAGGADRGALVAYVSAWALNGVSRILVFEVPLLGPEFALLRFVASLPLPVLAGALARRLPLEGRVR